MKKFSFLRSLLFSSSLLFFQPMNASLGETLALTEDNVTRHMPSFSYDQLIHFINQVQAHNNVDDIYTDYQEIRTISKVFVEATKSGVLVQDTQLNLEEIKNLEAQLEQLILKKGKDEILKIIRDYISYLLDWNNPSLRENNVSVGSFTNLDDFFRSFYDRISFILNHSDRLLTPVQKILLSNYTHRLQWARHLNPQLPDFMYSYDGRDIRKESEHIIKILSSSS